MVISPYKYTLEIDLFLFSYSHQRSAQVVMLVIIMKDWVEVTAQHVALPVAAKAFLGTSMTGSIFPFIFPCTFEL